MKRQIIFHFKQDGLTHRDGRHLQANINMLPVEVLLGGLFAKLPASEYFNLCRVNHRWSALLTDHIQWEEETAKICGRLSVPSLAKAHKVGEISKWFWKREFMRRHRSVVLDKCAFCGLEAIYRDPQWVMERGLMFCDKCYQRQVLEWELVEEIISRSLSSGTLSVQALTTMQLDMQPSMAHGEHKFPKFLKCDVKEYLRMVGGGYKRKEGWREDVRRALIKHGIEAEEAASLSENVFPPQGTPIGQVIDELLQKHDPAEYDRRKLLKAASKQRKDEKKRLAEEKFEAEQQARKAEVDQLLRSKGIDLALQPAFKGEIQRYIEGGNVNLQQIVSMMVGSQQKHKSVWDALDLVHHK